MKLLLSSVLLIVNLCRVFAVDDAGVPLILTPLLETGDITRAREWATVSLTTETPVKSYSGFFTVNKTANSNMFFWYFEASQNQSTAPTLIWLEGGPGTSGLVGVFKENGPFSLNDDFTFKDREFSWHKDHNLIYFDNPVGTGFSWSDEEGYSRNEIQVGINLYEAMLQFYIMFPELRSNRLFISGQSYAGKYVPALGHRIMFMNLDKPPETQMPLSGLIIGNGITDPINQLNYSDYLYQLGFLDTISKEYASFREGEIAEAIRNKEFKKARFIANGLLFYVYEQTLVSNYNYVEDNYGNEVQIEDLITKPEFRRAIHVGNSIFHNRTLVDAKLNEDFYDSVAPLMTDLINRYNVCTYNGQLDIMVPYISTANYLSLLDFEGKDDYLKSPKFPWGDGDVYGLVKKGGNLIEAVIRNAGHFAVFDQPKWVLDLVMRITHSLPFN